MSTIIEKNPFIYVYIYMYINIYIHLYENYTRTYRNSAQYHKNIYKNSEHKENYTRTNMNYILAISTPLWHWVEGNCWSYEGF
jgi:hypothetical protein